MRVATVFILIVLSIITNCSAEDSSNSNVSLLTREARGASREKSKNGKKVKKINKKKKCNKNKRCSRKNKNGKNKKQKNRKINTKTEKKRRLKIRRNKKKSKAKNKNRNQKNIRKGKAKKISFKKSKLRKTSKEIKNLSKNACTTLEEKKERTFIKQANRVQAWFNLLTTKGGKGEVFANYSKTLGEMTEGGTKCGPSAKDAYTFLSNCPATAKSSCNTTEFATNVSFVAECKKDINCSNISLQCRDTLNITYEGLKDLKKNKCLDSTFTGSFSNCMKFVKELGTDIIKSCVANIKETSGTCSGVIEEAGLKLIPVTEMASVTTSVPSRRSRKRFF